MAGAWWGNGPKMKRPPKPPSLLRGGIAGGGRKVGAVFNIDETQAGYSLTWRRLTQSYHPTPTPPRKGEGKVGRHPPTEKAASWAA